MKRTGQAVTVVLAAALLGGCATKGFVRRGLDEQRAALASERAERVAGDESAQAGIRGVRRSVDSIRVDLNALRGDLQALRADFGARIAAAEGQVTFIMPVHFNFDDASVRAVDEAALKRFAAVVGKYYRGATITVEGFADPAGSVAYNLRLSERRAESVKSYLAANGLAESQMRTVGYGKARQVRPGAAGNAAGAELNRRVTFVVETPAGTATVAALSSPD